MMTQEDFDQRVKAIEWMIRFAGEPATLLEGKKVVEIGSGFGAGAIAALTNGAAQYLGIEPSPFGTRIIELEGFDPGQRLQYTNAAKKIDKRNAMFFEGLAEEWPGCGFDICLIADVLEHVGDPLVIAKSAFDLLSPGGFVIASTAPLYYSPSGHHLFHIFDQATHPWAHLYTNFDKSELYSSVTEFFMSELESLNGVTHAQLKSAFLEAGFHIEKERTIENDFADFAEFKSRIDPKHLAAHDEKIFGEIVSQIVAVKPH